jgi:DNA topoisomerase-2
MTQHINIFQITLTKETNAMAAANQKIEDKYKKYELREHIYNIPDTYIGSVNSSTLELYLYDAETKKMEPKEITYVPGLLKIFDEVIVNAIDHSVRLQQEEDKGKENVKHLKTIKVNVDKATGTISVYNDGNGIDVVIHEGLQVYIPELVTGTLLTSTNYNHQEEKIIGGKGGYGLKLTNIFSKSFTVETVDHYRQKVFVQNFRNNMLEKDKPSVRATPKLPYTKITFVPDYERFGMKGITDDVFELFRRRTIDAAACTNKNVTVYFNDERLTVKDFEKYAELFVTKGTDPLIYEACNDRWEVAVSLSRNGTYEQISFVNGINTIRGGTHVNYVTNAIIKKLADTIEAKKKKTIKAQTLKDNLFIFVKSTIVNPAFDSQSKETLTTPVAKFGSKCEISDKFIEKLYKTSIVDRALSLTEFQNQKKLTKTDGKKTSRLIIPKLDDANLAGTKDSESCTLILTEGDSAKTMAIAGLSVIGRDKYGVFPLRGKVMNVKDAAAQKISDNAEITALKKILGLEQNKNYSGLDSLRYGKIMILTDQDHDGSHIKGLLFNVFQSLWPSLFKINGFLTSMLTPIIKATSSGPNPQVISFYNMSDYERWAQTKQTGTWKIKYYKGLGTSKDDEAKEYFKNMKKVTYIYNEQADEHIDLAFNKKRADDRKEWLMHYNKDDVLDYAKTDVNYDEFINRDLIHFSNRDLERSINHICDGLKESTRKILFACLKRKLYTNEIKVAQLAGNVSEVTAYHHGEQSLQQAIIGMAQIFVGTNNINILTPNGQFGSRLCSGQDASSPRYIFTLLSELTKLIFKEEDAPILNYLEEDGQMIQPEYYIPIIPMILVNGGVGIGTGFSTNIPQFNPDDIINSCLQICKAITAAEAKDKDAMYTIIDDIELAEFNPWYLGFTGAIEKGARGTYSSKGIYTWHNDTTLEITELPIGMWTEDYKEFLEQMITNNTNLLKSFENHYTSKNVRFVLHFSGDIRAKLGDKFETEFKLVSSKNLSINNMHLYSSEGAIKKYASTSNILKEWSKVRIDKYIERKAYQIKILEKDYNTLSNKIRFIIDVIEGRIIIMNKKLTEIASRLTELKYPKIQRDSDGKEDDEDSDAAAGAAGIAGYNYLLKMPISQLTYDRKIILEKEVAELAKKLDDLKSTSIEQIWKTELEQLLEAWHNHKNEIETDYINDKNGIVTQAKPKRKAPARAPAAKAKK